MNILRIIGTHFLWMFVLSVVSPILAVSTINGPTGLIEMPTAEALEYQKFNVGFDVQVDSETSDSYRTYKVNLGTFHNVELGFVGGSILDEGVLVNIKYFLMSDNQRYPVYIAVGMENVGSRRNSDIYLVASKRFQGGLRGHFGFKARFREVVDAAVMLGAEYWMDEKISVLGDVTGDRESFIYNIGARYLMGQDLFWRASIVDLASARDSESKLLIGVTFEKFM